MNQIIYENRATHNRVLEPHKVLFHEGDHSDHIYEISSGVVMLYKLLPDGRRQIIYVASTGDIVGFYAGNLLDCTVETLSDVTLKVYDRQTIDSSAPLQNYINRRLVLQMQRLQDHIVRLGCKTSFERVSSFLMELVPNRGGAECIGPDPSKCMDDKTVQLNMTRQEIADYLGLTIETVSRSLSKMQREGFIEIDSRSTIYIKNVCNVCNLTGFVKGLS
ncbi:Crp/Fnr family transcriptional regulator [Flexibacterium corallicola]|uniref:Crp/Fnr family transcriptional regulator n=1 Tax=Flexibacterium corallicola TaxID=3037259 RepID=UPI00286EE66F|nr:helix-turn-helix domain-containing protein [Pseudovibrio sp. M1P-2-3]